MDNQTPLDAMQAQLQSMSEEERADFLDRYSKKNEPALQQPDEKELARRDKIIHWHAFRRTPEDRDKLDFTERMIELYFACQDFPANIIPQTQDASRKVAFSYYDYKEKKAKSKTLTVLYGLSPAQVEFLDRAGKSLGSGWTRFLQTYRVKVSKSEFGNRITASFIGSNTTGDQAAVLLSLLHKLLTTKEIPLIQEHGQLSFFPLDEEFLYDPLNYTAERFSEASASRDKKEDLIRWIAQEWNMDRRNMNGRVFAHDIFNFRTLFGVVPFMDAVKLTSWLIAEKKWEPFSFEDWFQALSDGLTKAQIEPYRARTVRYLLQAPLVNNGISPYTFLRPQAMQNASQIPILYGQQGTGKSTFTQRLALGYYDSIHDLSDDSQQTILKKNENSILEFPEFEMLSTKKQAESKGETTKKIYKFLPKYENDMVTLNNVALIIGTTNKTSLLRDSTGNRRFLPLVVPDLKKQELTYPFILRAYATELAHMDGLRAKTGKEISLFIEETKEDLTFKRESYGLMAPDEVLVKGFWTDALAIALLKDDYNPKLGPVSDVFQGFGNHKGVLVFRICSQQALSGIFKSWVDEHGRLSDQGVWSGRALEVLRSTVGEAPAIQFKVTGAKKRGIAVEARSFLQYLNLAGADLTPYYGDSDAKTKQQSLADFQNFADGTFELNDSLPF